MVKGKNGTATIRLTKKIPNLPEGIADKFPLTVVLLHENDPTKPAYYHCRTKKQAEIVASHIVNAKGY